MFSREKNKKETLAALNQNPFRRHDVENHIPCQKHAALIHCRFNENNFPPLHYYPFFAPFSLNCLYISSFSCFWDNVNYIENTSYN
jgi:hypothetical protein